MSDTWETADGLGDKVRTPRGREEAMSDTGETAERPRDKVDTPRGREEGLGNKVCTPKKGGHV